jgi:hypothetical protein
MLENLTYQTGRVKINEPVLAIKNISLASPILSNRVFAYIHQGCRYQNTGIVRALVKINFKKLHLCAETTGGQCKDFRNFFAKKNLKLTIYTQNTDITT